jgi:hypothetical protein
MLKKRAVIWDVGQTAVLATGAPFTQAMRAFLRGLDRLAVLRSLAEDEVGHRAFLELGGARPVIQTIAPPHGRAEAVRHGPSHSRRCKC